jgi:glycosyltransferase involved in cell wall biosynthesis
LNIKFQKIDNGIKTAQKNNLKIELTKINFVSIGRIFEQKNYALLCAVMKSYSNLQAIVIGDLDNLDHDYYRKIQNQCPTNVHFIGKKENIGDYLTQADAFVMTSLYEGLPISALEALSLGVPILTTPAGGMVDLVENGINGFVSQDFSDESFTQIIDKFLSLSAEEINIIKQNNIDKFNANYNISQCVENYIKTYLN